MKAVLSKSLKSAFPLLLAGAFGAGVVGPASAAPEYGAAGQMDRKIRTESKTEAAERSRSLRQVSGTVVQTKQVNVKNGGDVLVAMLATNKGDRRLLVDLGPSKQDLNIAKGEKVSVEGVVTRLGDRQLLVAKRIKADGQIVKIDRESQIRQAERAHEAFGSRPGARRENRGIDKY